MNTPIVQDIHPLTSIQQGILAQTLKSPGQGMYMEHRACELSGPLDISRFRRAWDQVIARHSSLRSAFLWKETEQPVQVVLKEVDLPWQVVDWVHVAPSEAPAHLSRFIDLEGWKEIDLASAPAMRVVLFRLADDHHLLLWTNHHIMMDGWSRALVFSEILQCYRGLDNPAVASLPPARPFGDFVTWLARQELSDNEAWWKAEFKDFVPLPPPLRPTQSKAMASSRHKVAHRLPHEGAKALSETARRLSTSVAVLIEVAWASTLSRYLGVDDVSYGLASSGRPPELEGVDRMVGMFVHTVPVRRKLDGAVSLADLATMVMSQRVELERRAHTPLTTIQRWCGYSQREPLFQTILAIESFPMETGFGAVADGMEVRLLQLEERTNYPLGLIVHPGEAIDLELIYSSGYCSEDAERLLNYVVSLLGRMAGNPNIRLDALLQDVVEPIEPAKPPHEFCPIHEAFSAIAAVQPEALAVAAPDRSLTYGELHEISNAVAAELQARGTTSETIIGISVGRTSDAIIAILATLKAGGGYAPIEPEIPVARAQTILDISEAHLVLVDTENLERLVQGGIDRSRLCTVQDLAARGRGHAAQCRDTAPQSLAYVMFTSGSTGEPKGVMITHEGVAACIGAARAAFELRPASRVLLYESFSFDVSVLRIFTTLLSGASLHIVPEKERLEPHTLLSRLRKSDITFADFPPGIWAALPEHPLETLEAGSTGGDCFAFEAVAAWAPGRRFFNVYGPTEASIVTSMALLNPAVAARERLPVGTPLPHVGVHLLDEMMRPLPLGAVGEIYISGCALARGYAGRADLTADRFVPSPLPGAHGARMYRTGDLGKWSDLGLEILGRVDRQVKVRGFRVELEEIESVLAGHPAILDCAVCAIKVGPQQDLVAFIQLRDLAKATSQEIRTYVRARLPHYMTPARIELQDRLPRSPSGKIDRDALALQRSVTSGEGLFTTITQAIVREVWAGVLERDDLALESDFFDLGGHSLQAIDVIAKLENKLGKRIPVSTLFDEPTLGPFADALDALAVASIGAEFTAAEDDLRLSEGIRPKSSRRPRTADDNVLLTGATGGLGAVLLGRLLHETTSSITCLVRAVSAEDGLEKVRKAVRATGAKLDGFEERVRAVPSDISRPRLGLSNAIFDGLARETTSILHSAAQVSFVASYRALRGANVMGTRHILELACEGEAKALHFISTISVFGDGDARPRQLMETTPLAADPIFRTAYARTKWVAEHLVQDAADRGLEVAIYRPGSLVGATPANHDPGSFNEILLSCCLSIGSVPDVDFQVDITPMTFAAESIIALMTRRGGEKGPFHIINPQPASFTDCIASLDVGRPISVDSPELWYAKARALAEANRRHDLLAFLELSRDWWTRVQRDGTRFQAPVTLSALRALGIQSPPPVATLFQQHASALPVAAELIGAQRKPFNQLA